jgi:hypothetical protein
MADEKNEPIDPKKWAVEAAAPDGSCQRRTTKKATRRYMTTRPTAFSWASALVIMGNLH